MEKNLKTVKLYNSISSSLNSLDPLKTVSFTCSGLWFTMDVRALKTTSRLFYRIYNLIEIM